MNTRERIEKCLKAAPKPPAQDGLLDKLLEDVDLSRAKAQRSALRRWFVPTGGQISVWRVAAAAVVAIAVVLPLSYGATKAMKHLITFEAKFEYPEDNTVYGVKSGMSASDKIQTEEDARRAEEEFYELYKEGKAEEVEPGVWVATLSDGENFAYGGDPEHLGLSDSKRKELLKQQFDEINELRKAGEFDKTYMPELDFEINGVKYRFFRARYVLSDGTVKTVGSSEAVTEDDD